MEKIKPPGMQDEKQETKANIYMYYFKQGVHP